MRSCDTKPGQREAPPRWRSTRFKLSISLVGVAVLAGVASLLVGGLLLYDAMLREARTRIRLDLNAARVIYCGHVSNVALALEITALGTGFQAALQSRNTEDLQQRVERLARHARLNFAGVVGPDGQTLCRLGMDAPPGGSATPNPLVDYTRERRVTVAGTVVLEREFLLAENPTLAEGARLRIVPPPNSAPEQRTESLAGLALAAASPVFDGEELVGVLYGGMLLNQRHDIVDTVCETVFQNETFRGRSIGTATIFLGDLRIATNVRDSQGRRAIGTLVSPEVRERVLVKGQPWTGRAFVVNEWYLSAYEPVEDLAGRPVGMLCVGILEAKYVAAFRKFLAMFALFTAAGVGAAIGLGCHLANRISGPIQRLIQASAEVARGNFAPDLGPVSTDEIGLLQQTFAGMLAALREQMQYQRAESESRLLQSEKQASVGRLAAGVAHEINNPLTGVLTFTHMLLRRTDLTEDVRADLQTIARETERVRRIVKGLLDFSRQTRLDPEPTDINRLVATTLSLVENQALIKGLNLEFKPCEGLPVRTLDRSQMQSALLNILLNAIDATDPGGRITVTTGLSVFGGSTDRKRKGVEITVKDTGCGIPPEHLDKLFDPFFTTKEIGQGTGLGLSVSHGIVERHGGMIRVQSEPGHGSTFTIWLPLEETGEKLEDHGS